MSNSANSENISNSNKASFFEKLAFYCFRSKPMVVFAAHFRFLPVLNFVKKISRYKLGYLFSGLFDPNFIRKKINIIFHPKAVSISSYGGTFWVDVNEHLGYQFFMNDGFDPLILEVAESLEIDKNSILLDVGANIGSTCVPFAMKYDAEVIAVEASKQNASFLLKNANVNKAKLWPHIVAVVDSETAAKESFLKFFTKSGNSAANSLFQGWNPSKAEATFEYVKATTLDGILSNVDLRRIKIIKIDVEGAEEMVLNGFTKMSSVNAPILFEYRVDIMERDLGQNGSGMIHLLNRDHEIYGIEEISGKVFLVTFNPQVSYANAIALPKSNLAYFKGRFEFKNL